MEPVVSSLGNVLIKTELGLLLYEYYHVNRTVISNYCS